MAFQMGGTIYLGSLLGSWLDVKFENENQFYFKGPDISGCFFSHVYCDKKGAQNRR